MRILHKRFDSPVICVLIAAPVFLAFIFGRLYQSNFDVSSFVVAGDRYCNRAAVPSNLTVLNGSAGFDGQFYYRLGLNPFTRQPTEFGITLDNAPLRHQRILYPALAWALSFGNPNLVPPVLVIINFVALCLMAWLGGSYAQRLGEHALWGIFPALYPGFLLSLSRDTVEILEAVLILASLLLLLRRRKPAVATSLLALAILTKETAVLVALAAALVYLVARVRKGNATNLPWYYAALPILVFALWQFVLFRVWGELPLRASGSLNLSLPFVEPVRSLFDALIVQRPAQIRKSAELIFLLGYAVAVLFQLRSTRASQHEIVTWLLLTMVAVSLGSTVWIEDWTFVRVLSPFFLVGALIVIAGTPRIRYAVFSASLLFWGLLFFKLMRSYALA